MSTQNPSLLDWFPLILLFGSLFCVGWIITKKLIRPILRKGPPFDISGMRFYHEEEMQTVRAECERLTSENEELKRQIEEMKEKARQSGPGT